MKLENSLRYSQQLTYFLYSEAHEIRPRPNTPIPRNPLASLDHPSKIIVWLLDKNFVPTSQLNAFHVSHFSLSSFSTFTELREGQSLKS
jgi:hypothetical protein